MNEFNQTMDQTTEAGSTGVRMAALPAVVTALLLGTFLVFAAGMAQSDTFPTIENAAARRRGQVDKNWLTEDAHRQTGISLDEVTKAKVQR